MRLFGVTEVLSSKKKNGRDSKSRVKKWFAEGVQNKLSVVANCIEFYI